MKSTASLAFLLCGLFLATARQAGGTNAHRGPRRPGNLQSGGHRHRNKFNIVEDMTEYSSVENKVIFHLDPQSSDLICRTCLEISSEAERVLNDPDFTEKVDMISSRVCQILPPDLESKCLETLEVYLEDIFSYLRNIFDRENLCYSTGFCAESAKTLSPGVRKSQVLTLPEFSLFGSFLETSRTKACVACRNASGAILTALESPKTKIKIIKILLKACERVEDHAPECKQLVFEYGPIILSKVEKYLQSNDLCALAEFCQEFSDFPTPEED